MPFEFEERSVRACRAKSESPQPASDNTMPNKNHLQLKSLKSRV